MNAQKTRDDLQHGIYKVINPFVKFLIKIGVTPNTVTLIGLILNIGVAVIFIAGGEEGNRGDLSYVGWAGVLILFAGLFDMMDGQVARLGNMHSPSGALFDSVLDRYSELILFFGICYYLISHHYFFSSLFAFIALIGSMMVSYTRARAEGLGVECKSGMMQRPERIVLISLSAIACGITGHFIGGNYKLYIPGIRFHVLETMSVFTIPITVMAILTNITAIGRLKEAARALDKKEKENRHHKMNTGASTLLAFPLILLLSAGLPSATTGTAKVFTPYHLEITRYNPSDTFPTPPPDKKMLFYLQRTSNANTVVYELNYDSKGQLNADKPIHVYWIRYTEPGNPRKELNFIQRKFAYGVKVKQESADVWNIRLVSYDKILLQLRRGSDGKYAVFTHINNKENIFKKAFAKINGGTFWFPNVVYIELSGIDEGNGKPVSQKIYL